MEVRKQSSTTGQDYQPLTGADLRRLLDLTAGGAGTRESETSISRVKGDRFWTFCSGIGADCAAVLRRNPKAIQGWKLWQGDDWYTLFLKLDPELVRSPGLWVKPAVTPEQRAARREKGRRLAEHARNKR